MQQSHFSKQIMVGRSTMDTNKSDAAGIIFRSIISIDNNRYRLPTSKYYCFIPLFTGIVAKNWSIRCNV